MATISAKKSQELNIRLDTLIQDDLVLLVDRLNSALHPRYSVYFRSVEPTDIELVIGESQGTRQIELAACYIGPLSDSISAMTLSGVFADLVIASGLGLSIFKPTPKLRQNRIAAQ
jgi:hypothetical protein